MNFLGTMFDIKTKIRRKVTKIRKRESQKSKNATLGQLLGNYVHNWDSPPLSKKKRPKFRINDRKTSQYLSLRKDTSSSRLSTDYGFGNTASSGFKGSKSKRKTAKHSTNRISKFQETSSSFPSKRYSSQGPRFSSSGSKISLSQKKPINSLTSPKLFSFDRTKRNEYLLSQKAEKIADQVKKIKDSGKQRDKISDLIKEEIVGKMKIKSHKKTFLDAFFQKTIESTIKKSKKKRRGKPDLGKLNFNVQLESFNFYNKNPVKKGRELMFSPINKNRTIISINTQNDIKDSMAGKSRFSKEALLCPDMTNTKSFEAIEDSFQNPLATRTDNVSKTSNTGFFSKKQLYDSIIKIQKEKEGEQPLSIQDQQIIKFIHPPLYTSLGQAVNEDIENTVEYEKMRIKLKYKYMRFALKEFLKKLSRLQITPTDFYKHIIFPRTSYQSPLSRVFIDACKYNNFAQVYSLLNQDRYVVHQFDHIKMTGLHWACKKGYLELVKLLIKNHADPEASDILERTPLYFSLKNQERNISCFLLGMDSNPWTPSDKYNYMMLTHDNYTKMIIKDCRIMEIKIELSSLHDRKKMRKKLKAEIFSLDQFKEEIVLKREQIVQIILYNILQESYVMIGKFVYF